MANKKPQNQIDSLKSLLTISVTVISILVSYPLAYKLILSRIYTNKLASTVTTQESSKSVVLPTQSQKLNTSENKLEWNNLEVIYKNSPFNAKVEMSLSSMGNLSSPEFDSLENYLLAVYPKDDEIKNVKLLKPLVLKFDLEYIKNRLTKCGYDIDTVKIYTNSKDEKSGIYGVDELKTKIDPTSNSITAELTELKGYQQYGIFTDIVIGAKPTKYLWGCGEEAEAWIDDKYLINKKDGYKLELPSDFARPMMSEGLTNNRINIYPKSNQDSQIKIVTLYNWQKLTIKNLDQLRHSGYEMSPDSDYFEGEMNKSSQVLNFSNQDFLEVKSSKDGNEIYRLITTFNTNKENYVFVIEVLFNKSSLSKYDNYVIAVKDIAKSFAPL